MNKRDIASIATVFSLAFSTGAIAQSMSKADYKSGKDNIAAEYKSATAACASMSGNAKDICRAEAKGKQNVAKAELEARYTPSKKTRHAVNIAKAKADYSVAKEKCDDKSGNDKKICAKEAKAAETSAIADARAQMKTSDANKIANEKSTVSTRQKESTAAASKKETAGEYVDDSVITAKVKAAVLEESSLKSAEINVETSKGRVQLSGFVRSRADINKAVEIAKGVKGVKSVNNDMILKGTQ